MILRTCRWLCMLPAAIGLCSACQVGEAAGSDVEVQRYFALNLYHEARSEGPDGMLAIGWVVLNRISDDYYPNDPVSVITQQSGSSCEFGWWCDGQSDKPNEPESWNAAQDIAGMLLSEVPPADPTEGALWFHHTSIDRPDWMGDDVIRTATLGDHHFYARLIP